MCPSRERGQALVIVVAILGLAALVAISLRDADDRLLARIRAQRAAEAAAEAGGAVVADRLVELARQGVTDAYDAVELAVSDDSLRSRAELAAADVLGRMSARLDVLLLERRADEVSIRVVVRRAGVTAVARAGARMP
jgi:hypothetical protein